MIYTRPLTMSFLIGSELAPAETYTPRTQKVQCDCQKKKKNSPKNNDKNVNKKT